MMCNNLKEMHAERQFLSLHKPFTKHFSERHAFKVLRYCELGELVKANSLKFYRPFDLQCLYGSDDIL